MNTPTFADLGLSPEIVAAVEKKGFKTPSPIQAGVIPLLLSGDKDIIGQAQTGTGKTAAFALPLLERLDVKKKQTQALILVPTRELAMQVAKEIASFSVPNSPTVAVVYGGNHMREEIRTLNKNPQIVVGTPGRAQHHIRNRNLRMEYIQYFVLDEADEMLNFGFREEIEEMLKLTPPDRRVLLFSATMPQSILSIVHNYMGDHDTVKAAAKEMTNENITQKYYCTQSTDKFEALCRIMEAEENFYAIIFCRTKIDTDHVASQFAARHLRAEAIHGDIDQSQREKILRRFRDRKINILVATDVAARGIDISELNFVVNYELPVNFEAYTHRIGRTGRAGNKGTAISMIGPRDMNKLRMFERNLKVTMEKGTLPTPKDLIAKKQLALIERLEHIQNTENTENLIPLAEQLLEEGDAKQVIATLLRDSYKNDFDITNYRFIADVVPSTFNSRSGGGRSGGGYRRNGGGYRGKSSGGFSRKPASSARGDFPKRSNNYAPRSGGSKSKPNFDKPKSGFGGRPPAGKGGFKK